MLRVLLAALYALPSLDSLAKAFQLLLLSMANEAALLAPQRWPYSPCALRGCWNQRHLDCHPRGLLGPHVDHKKQRFAQRMRRTCCGRPRSRHVPGPCRRNSLPMVEGHPRSPRPQPESDLSGGGLRASSPRCWCLRAISSSLRGPGEEGDTLSQHLLCCLSPPRGRLGRYSLALSSLRCLLSLPPLRVRIHTTPRDVRIRSAMTLGRVTQHCRRQKQRSC